MHRVPDSLDLAELSDRAGVSQRTVRYYIQQGLLPSPEARGPGAHYGPEHLDRLLVIRSLQREHLPLAEIRRRLETLTPAEIRTLAEGRADRTSGDARDYIRDVLSGGRPKLSSLRVQEPVAAAAPMLAEQERSFDPMPQRKAVARSQWDRIALTADVELHVRRPLTREQNKQIERLLDAARHIFEEG